MGNIYKRDNKWYVDFRTGGKRIRKAVSGDRQVTKDILKELEGRGVRGEYNLKDNKYPVQSLKDNFLKHKKLTLKPRTFEGYKQDLDLILRELNLKLVSDIDSSLIDVYVEKRLSRVSERTVNLEIQTLKQMLNYGVEIGKIKNNPITNFKPLETRNKKI